MAVGYYYSTPDVPFTLAELWNGSSWSIVPTPTPSGAIGGELLDISCASTDSCLAVGGYYFTSGPEQALAEFWNGSSWALEDPQQPSGVNGAELSGVSCLSTSSCMTVGHVITGSSTASNTLVESWTGGNWSIVPTPPNPTGYVGASLSGISCVSVNWCVAVGDSSSTGSPAYTSLAEEWNGSSWTIETTPLFGTTGDYFPNELFDVSCWAVNACTAAGAVGPQAFNGALVEGWNGSSWTVQTTPSRHGISITDQLSGISCSSSTECQGVGSEIDDATQATDTIAERFSAGSWSREGSIPGPAGPTDLMHSVSCASSTDCIAVGYFKTSSGSWSTLAAGWKGGQWSREPTPNLETGAPAAPTCPAPAVPAATYPPGQSYGVPFKAEVSGGQVYSGYDEWEADNNSLPLGANRTITQFPWKAKIYGVTGWVTGLIELPSLSTEITAQDFAFCDQGDSQNQAQGATACVDQNVVAPPGQCLHFVSVTRQVSSTNGQVIKPSPTPPVTNLTLPGFTCYPGTPTGVPGCSAYDLSLLPSGTTSLNISGVEADGALDLSVTSAATTSAVFVGAGVVTDAQQIAPTDVVLGTQLSTVPSPPGPSTPTNLCGTSGATEPCNTDYRPLQVPPAPLTGPLSSASTTAGGNDFGVPVFEVNGKPDFGIASELDSYASGWGSSIEQVFDCYTASSEVGAIATGCPPYVNGQVADPGWTQFSASTNVVSVGLPVGPPQGFAWP
ncbi:MAG TPA: hypothetical protein VEJ87_10055 [Acidimicrobiales bacterium]|nr:hypothetical protein [Acidimicrobiales bacterium]